MSAKVVCERNASGTVTLVCKHNDSKMLQYWRQFASISTPIPKCSSIKDIDWLLCSKMLQDWRYSLQALRHHFDTNGKMLQDWRYILQALAHPFPNAPALEMLANLQQILIFATEAVAADLSRLDGLALIDIYFEQKSHPGDANQIKCHFKFRPPAQDFFVPTYRSMD